MADRMKTNDFSVLVILGLKLLVRLARMFVALEERLVASTCKDTDPTQKNFGSEWPQLPLAWKAPPLGRFSGQPLTVYGRRLVNVDFEGQSCFLQFYVCDVPYCVVSIGRLLRHGLMPVAGHGSLLLLRPALSPLNKDEFEVVCNTFTTRMHKAPYNSGPNCSHPSLHPH